MYRNLKKKEGEINGTVVLLFLAGKKCYEAHVMPPEATEGKVSIVLIILSTVP